MTPKQWPGHKQGGQRANWLKIVRGPDCCSWVLTPNLSFKPLMIDGSQSLSIVVERWDIFCNKCTLEYFEPVPPPKKKIQGTWVVSIPRDCCPWAVFHWGASILTPKGLCMQDSQLITKAASLARTSGLVMEHSVAGQRAIVFRVSSSKQGSYGKKITGFPLFWTFLHLKGFCDASAFQRSCWVIQTLWPLFLLLLVTFSSKLVKKKPWLVKSTWFPRVGNSGAEITSPQYTMPQVK